MSARVVQPAAPALAAALLCLPLAGCAFGPRLLEQSHGRYNEAVKQVSEEQLLLNIVRTRYHDNPMRLDVSSIAAQYELDANAAAQPFFAAQSSNGLFRSFAQVLPLAGAALANRPTISLTPLDDPENVRSLFTPSTLDGTIFLSETSYPVGTVFRLFVEYLNRLPNAVTASGPPRDIVPEFRDFLRAVELLQLLKDRDDLRFLREEKVTEVGSPVPAAAVTSTALVEAAKNGFEYRQRPDQTWVLVRRDRRLEVRLNPAVVGSPEVQELTRLLRLRPGQLGYPVTVGSAEEAYALSQPPEEAPGINLFPRSLVQVTFYLSHGVVVPPEHLECGVVKPALEPDGTVFDWQQLMGGLFTVHADKQCCRPKHAYVAVKYRGYWFYVDDRDADSKVTFSLVMTMTRVNLLGVRKGGPALTLPVGR